MPTLTEEKDIEELRKEVKELKNQLKEVKKQENTRNTEQEKTTKKNKYSRRDFLKALGGGAAGIGAAAMIPGAAGFTFKDDKAFKFSNLSSSQTNFEVGKNGDLNLHSNKIQNTSKIDTQSLNFEDSQTNPTSNGEITRNGKDVKIQTGDTTKNITNLENSTAGNHLSKNSNEFNVQTSTIPVGDLQNVSIQAVLEGPESDKPSAGTAGRFYWTTDTKILYRDDGNTWNARSGRGTESDPIPGTTHLESANIGELEGIEIADPGTDIAPVLNNLSADDHLFIPPGNYTLSSQWQGDVPATISGLIPGQRRRLDSVKPTITADSGVSPAILITDDVSINHVAFEVPTNGILAHHWFSMDDVAVRGFEDTGIDLYQRDSNDNINDCQFDRCALEGDESNKANYGMRVRTDTSTLNINGSKYHFVDIGDCDIGVELHGSGNKLEIDHIQRYSSSATAVLNRHIRNQIHIDYVEAHGNSYVEEPSEIGLAEQNFVWIGYDNSDNYYDLNTSDGIKTTVIRNGFIAASRGVTTRDVSLTEPVFEQSPVAFSGGQTKVFAIGSGYESSGQLIADATPVNSPGNDHGYRIEGIYRRDSDGEYILEVTETQNAGGGDARVVVHDIS